MRQPRFFTRAFAVLLSGAAFFIYRPVPADAQQYPDQNCTATMANRSVPVAADGTFAIPNVPVNPGEYRVRVVCQRPDGTVLGYTSDYTSLVADGLNNTALQPLTPLTAQPSRLRLLVISGALSSVGATAQLETQALNDDDFAYNYTALTKGTTYSTSNPEVAIVDSNGLVTAKGPGTVVITARNDGLASTIMLTSFGLLDSDGDGMPDAYEIANGLNPYDPTDGGLDSDGDGLTNLQEFQLGTNPHAADTDGDGLSDGDEIKLGTNPLVADTDGDGLTDGDEVRLGTNPLLADTDGDGIPDGIEVKIGTNPLVPDVTTTVTGHVTKADGTPYLGASVVTLNYATAVTDSTGAFAMLNIPVTLGNIVVSARAVVGNTVSSGASTPTTPVARGVTDVGTIQLGQSSGQVSGIVYSPDNKPVVAATVTVVDGTDVRSTITDGGGIYIVSGLQPGTVSVAAFDPATSLRGQAAGVLTAGGPLTLNVNLGGFGTVTGTVRNAAGTPVGAGVAVAITGTLNATTTTDSLGHYTFSFVPLGAFNVTSTDSSGNFGRTTGTVTATAQTIKADVQYLGRGTVTGTVSDGQGHAVAGAAITLVNSGVASQQLTATTDSLGKYSISGVYIGTVNVAATLAASNSGGSGSGNITADGQTVTVNLTLSATANISGTVFRKDGSTPVSGAVVQFNGTGFRATANASGQYSINNVPLGAYQILATDPASADRGSGTAALGTAGQTVTVNVNMVGTGSLVVTVLDGSGTPVSGATVEVDGNGPFYQNQNGVTGSNGTATVNQQVAGGVSVSARNPLTGLSGTANATVTAGSSTAVTVNLQPFGTITGHVYKHDAGTPLPSAIVQLDGGQQALTDANGLYTLSTVPSGSHSIQVLDSLGNLLAYNNSVVISTQGQSVTADFVIIGRGTVTGHVTYTDGTAAAGIPVQLTSSAPGDNHSFGTQTDATGAYSIPLVPVGGYTLVAQQHSATANLYGTATGSVPSDGATATTNVQISSTLVPSTSSFTDANGFTYPVRENGGLYDGSYALFNGDGGAHEGGSVLSIVLNGNSTAFTGAAFSTSGVSGRQVSIEQDGLDGLNVTRRVYVPGDGYFARYLELLTNPTAQDITVGVQLNSYFRAITEDFKNPDGSQNATVDVPHILSTSSGDNVLNVADPNTPDTWVTLGGPADRDPFLPDQFADTPIPAFGHVFSGPGAALKPGSAGYIRDAGGLFSTLAESFTSVRVPAGGTVGILHFVTQENEYSAANAAAARLAKVPRESLLGLTSTDKAAIANFVLPAGDTYSVPDLPTLTNQVNGFVYASDGTTRIAYPQVHLQSSDPIFGRTYIASGNADGSYGFQGSYGGLAVPPENYSVYASHPTSTSPLTPACAQSGHYVNSGCAIDSPTFTGTFDANATQSATDITFSNTGILTGTISRGPTVLNVAGTVTITGSAMGTFTLPIAADGTYTVTGMLPGNYTIAAAVTNTLLTGQTTTTITAGHTTTANITIVESGSLQGKVTRPDGTLAINDTINLRVAGTSLQAIVDTSGHYSFTDIPTGSYTVDVYDSLSNAAATATVAITANSTTTQDLALQSSGTVNGTVTVNDGSSVSGLTVTLSSTTSSGTQTLSTTTDANGKFTFTSVKPGSISVHTSTSAGLQGTGTGSLPLAGQSVTINISLVSAGTVTGTVFQADGTTRASGIQVKISPAPLTGSDTTTTDANGSYTFANQPFGGFTVYATNTANADRGQASSQIQTNGQVRTVNITLNGYGTLIVKVKDASNNVTPNAAVTVTNYSIGNTYKGTTDSTGTATFSNIYAGSFSVYATDPVTNLGAQQSGTLVANATQTVSLTLQAIGTIKGVVYAVDGTTPVAGATVQLNAPYGLGVTTGADGSYIFNSQSVGGSYNFQARDSNNVVRATAPAQILQSNGQVITQNLTFLGVGSVTGTVYNVDGSRATNVALTLLSKNSTIGGSRNLTAGGDGTYSAVEVPIGAFTVTVNNLGAGLAGFASGTITGDGDHETADIQIQSSTVTLPTTLTDADGFTYPISSNGQYYTTANNFFGYYPFYSAQALQLTVGNSTSSFGDSSSPTTASQALSGQQIEINQPSLQGLNVTRKIYVPGDGYFARRLEVLQNTSSTPVTVTVSITGTDRFSTLGPQIVKTSNNDTTVNNTILWAADDDDSGTLPYPASQPAHANVFAGTGGATGMQAVTYTTNYYPGYSNNPSYTAQNWTYKYQAVTIPANSKVSFLFFTAQEASSTTAISAAQRLVQLPAEALAGLSSDDLASVVNFKVPATPLAAVHPPSTAAALTGRALTGDGVIPIPHAKVYAQSTDPEYSGGVSATADANGQYTTPLLTAGGYAVYANDPSTGVNSTIFTGNFTAGVASVTQDIPFTNTGIVTGIVKATGNGSIGSGTIYMSFYCTSSGGGTNAAVAAPNPGAPNASGNSSGPTYCGNASTTYAADGTFGFLTVPTGNQNIAASIYLPQGNYVYLPQGGSYFGVDVPAKQTTQFTFTIPASGNITGKVTNADGTPAGGVTVFAIPSDYNKGSSESTKTAADGTYALTYLLLDTYTVTATDPSTGSSVSKTTAVMKDASSTVDLTFIGKGTVVLTVKYASGNVGQNASIYLSTSTMPAFSYAGTTDSNGQITLSNVPTGSFTVRAYYPNYSFYTTITGTIVGTGNTVNLPVTLPAVGTISGTVTLANGSPASGQSVYIRDASNTFSNYAATDSAGNYAMFPVPADRTVTVTSTYYNSTYNKNVTAAAANQQISGDGQTLTVNLRYAGFANVKVTALKKDGTPYTSGSIGLKSNDGAQNYYGNIGADGSYTFTNIQEATFVAYAYVSGYGFNAGSKIFTVGPADDGTTVQVTINTTPTGTVKGQVYAADGTTVIQGNYAVDITDIDAQSTNSANPSNGVGYNFTNAQFGASGFTLTARLNSIKQTVTGNITTDGQVITHDFTLPVSSISGAVYLYDGTTPLANAQVFVAQTINGAEQDYYAYTDDKGQYQISGPVAGTITISSQDNNGVTGTATATLASDTSILTSVNINLPAVGIVTGLVYTNDGKPLANQYVDVTSGAGDGAFTYTTYTDDKGNYTATDIPAGNITVTVYDSTAQVYETGNGVLEHNGDTITINVGNVPTAQAGQIFGTVFDGDQDPSSGATVTASPVTQPDLKLTVQTDQDGKYAISGLPLGDITVSAVLADGTPVDPVTGTIASYSQAIEIDLGLTDFGNVSGIVTDADGNPVANANIGLASTGDTSVSYGETTGQDGGFYFTGIAPGVVTATVKDDQDRVIGTAQGVLPYGGNLTLNVTTGPPAAETKRNTTPARKQIKQTSGLMLPSSLGFNAPATLASSSKGMKNKHELRDLSVLHLPALSARRSTAQGVRP